MKIYTKTGDTGETGLFGGPRVAKDAPRIEAYGTVDELNSVLGLARTETLSSSIDVLLGAIQNELFALGADSLQVFRIAAHLEREDIAVSARELMKNPTIATLAQRLEGKPAAARDVTARKVPALADFRHGARRRTLAP